MRELIGGPPRLSTLSATGRDRPKHTVRIRMSAGQKVVGATVGALAFGVFTLARLRHRKVDDAPFDAGDEVPCVVVAPAVDVAEIDVVDDDVAGLMTARSAVSGSSTNATVASASSGSSTTAVTWSAIDLRSSTASWFSAAVSLTSRSPAPTQNSIRFSRSSGDSACSSASMSPSRSV